MMPSACLLLLLAGVTHVQEQAPEPASAKGNEQIVLKRGKRPLFMELWRGASDPAAPLLVLYHRARSSRGEYKPMLPRLRALGYDCLAVDLSTGGACQEVSNRTVAMSGLRDWPSFPDTLPDIEDSLRWAREHRPQAKVVAWGSSFSAALVLRVAAEHPELLDGVIAFSPTECFEPFGKSATWVQEAAASVRCPVFMSSARSEESEWKAIFAAIPAETKTSFLPVGAGTSGSAALWERSRDHAEYWAALEPFLARHFPVPAPAPATPPSEDG